MKLSVSMLSGYEYCKKKLFLQYVLKIAEPPKEVLVLGSIRHEVFDLINKKEESIVKKIKTKKTLEQLQQIYKSEHSFILRELLDSKKSVLKNFNLTVLDVFKKSWPVVMAESMSRADNLHKFIEKSNLFGDVLWEQLTPKIESEFSIASENLNLKGVIDRLEIYKEGYVPIELKTGSSPREGAWPGHKIQVCAYAMLLEDKFKVNINEGFIIYLDAQKRQHIPINPFLKMEVKELIGKVNSLLNNREIPEFCGNENKCRACGLRERCYNKKYLETKLKEKIIC